MRRQDLEREAERTKAKRLGNDKERTGKGRWGDTANEVEGEDRTCEGNILGTMPRGNRRRESRLM